MSPLPKTGTNFHLLLSVFYDPPSLPPWDDVVYGCSLICPARLIGPARLTILKKNSLPARLTEPARLTIFRKKSTLLA